MYHICVSYSNFKGQTKTTQYNILTFNLIEYSKCEKDLTKSKIEQN